MIRAILHRVIDNWVRPLNYDATYMHQMLDASIPAMLKFMMAQLLSQHQEGISKEARTAARLVTIQHEDCGPCAQLVVNMALQDGVDPAFIRKVIARAYAELPPIINTTILFTDAVLAHAPCDAERETLRQAFGEKGLVTLALSISQTRTYPTIKRVLGYAHVCERLEVRGEMIPVIKAA